MSTTQSRWLVGQALPRPRLRLIVFPYAGGGPSAFVTWQAQLPADVEMRVVQLPGRGGRLTELPVRQLERVVAPLATALLPLGPLVFYGHSLGAFVAFEVARYLRRLRHTQMLKLIVSGQRAPQLPQRTPMVHAWPDAEFIADLRAQAGTPEAVLANAELMQLLLPMLRADFALCETYGYRAEPPLAIPITAWGGETDPKVTGAELAAWQVQTQMPLQMRRFAGGHFFLHDSEAAVLAALRAELATL